MANQGGKWETVVKKKGPVTKSDVKKAQQKFYDNVTHQQFEETTKNPLQETKTIYQPFVGSEQKGAKVVSSGPDKENEQTEKYPSLLHASYSSPGKAGKAQQSTKGNQVKKKAKPMKPDPLLAAIEKLRKTEVDSLDSFITGLKDRFPSHPTVWLRDVASWLQMQVDGPVEKDLALRDQEEDFPSNQLPSEATTILEDLFKSCSGSCLASVVNFCIASMLVQVQQGKTTIGYRVFCQLLVKYRPQILKEKFDEIITGRNNTADSYHVLMWVFGQSTDDLRQCIEVWWKVFVPVLKVRQHAGLAVDYLDKVLRKHKTIQLDKPLLKCSEFLSFLELAFSNKSPLSHTPSAKAKLMELYPFMKDLLFTNDISKHCAVYFKYFLKALNTDEVVVKAELITLLTTCIRHDHASIDAWKGILRNNLVESSILLQYMGNNKVAVSQQLASGRMFKSKIRLEDIFRDFLGILLEMHHKGEGSKVGFAESYEVCKRNCTRKDTKRRESSRIWKLLKYTSIMGLILFSVDIWKHRGWQGSKAQEMSVATGADIYAAEFVAFMQKTGEVSQNWLAKNAPYYYKEIHPRVEYAMETTRHYATNASIYLYEKSEPVRSYLNENLPIVFEKVDGVVAECWTVVSTWSLIAWEAAFPYVKQGIDYGKYVVFDVLPKVKDNVVRSWMNGVSAIYSLNPQFFNNLSITIASTWEKMVDFAPIAMTKVQEFFAAFIRSISGCIEQGQTWIHSNIMSPNASPSAATTK